jgi:hypothetical protein
VKSKDTISKGPKKRDPTCLQARYDITIPAGTILRQDPGKEGFSCPIAGGKFVITDEASLAHEGSFKRVIA